MGSHSQDAIVDQAFARIEAAILPTLSLMLDTLLDSATLGQPGTDADMHAAELRAIAWQLDVLIGQFEALSATRPTAISARAATTA
jgi:hypothetical protein